MASWHLARHRPLIKHVIHSYHHIAQEMLALLGWGLHGPHLLAVLAATCGNNWRNCETTKHYILVCHNPMHLEDRYTCNYFQCSFPSIETWSHDKAASHQ